MSDTKVSDLGVCATEKIRFRISVPKDAEHCGGFTLFGKGFGDYDEGITCKFICAR